MGRDVLLPFVREETVLQTENLGSIFGVCGKMLLLAVVCDDTVLQTDNLASGFAGIGSATHTGVASPS